MRRRAGAAHPMDAQISLLTNQERAKCQPEDPSNLHLPWSNLHLIRKFNECLSRDLDCLGPDVLVCQTIHLNPLLQLLFPRARCGLFRAYIAEQRGVECRPSFQ